MENEPRGIQPPCDRLDSWKEIAAYLKRDVTTVQRWERREAMPVQRHRHDKLWSVYAFRSELDAWWESRSSRSRNLSPRTLLPEMDAAPESERSVHQETRGGWLMLGVGSALTVLLALGLAARVFWIGGRTEALDPAAHQEYLVGRYYLWRYEEEHLKRAIEHFERATLMDPSHAAAFAALSNAWWARGIFGSVGLRAAELPARRAAETAFKLNPRLAAAYVAKADLKRLYDRDLAGAEVMFRRALGLDPNSVEAHHSYAMLLMAMGRFPEALAHIGRAAALDPLAPAAQSNFARILYRAGRYEEALPHIQRALALEPGMRPHYGRLGDIYEQLGQYERALEAYDRIGDRGPTYKARVARILARMGRPREARLLLGELAAAPDRVPLSLAAAAHAALGDRNQASALLATMIERRDPGPAYFPVDPLFASLRSAPQWPELLRRTGFRTESQR